VTQFHTHTLKKQTTAVMPLEVMKQQNYFCNDITSGANLWEHAAILQIITANSYELYLQILGTFWSYNIYLSIKNWRVKGS